jgi:hypothetical protein
MHGQEKHVIISMVFQEMEESLKERISNPVPTPEIEK